MNPYTIQESMEELLNKFPDVESLTFNNMGKWVLRLDRGTVTEDPIKFNSLFAVVLYLENLPPLND